MPLGLFKKTKQLTFDRTYDARSWTEGEEDTSTIEHTNQVTLSPTASGTEVKLTIDITKIGAKAKMAAFGMRWGYQAQLDQLGELLPTWR